MKIFIMSNCSIEKSIFENITQNSFSNIINLSMASCCYSYRLDVLKLTTGLGDIHFKYNINIFSNLTLKNAISYSY